MEKKAYTTPKLLVHGDVAEITQGGVHGKSLDGFLTRRNGTGALPPPPTAGGGGGGSGGGLLDS
jgi:hypothetical protein